MLRNLVSSFVCFIFLVCYFEICKCGDPVDFLLHPCQNDGRDLTSLPFFFFPLLDSNQTDNALIKKMCQIGDSSRRHVDYFNS